MPEISVIVPVYNVEKYLRPCIDSILAQTFTDFELILVDDGSPDRCGEICDEYKRIDKRIRVIHQENGGLSAARNAGLDIMSGTYVTFIDSDDIICVNYLDVLYQDIVKQNGQISSVQLLEFVDVPRLDKLDSMQDYFILTGKEAALHIYLPDHVISVTACGKLFCKDLFEERRFPIGKIHEDEALVPILLYISNRVIINSKMLYGYRIREDSIMHKNFSIKRYDAIDAFNECLAFFKQNNDKKLVCAVLNRINETIALYALYARKFGVYKDVPLQYKISSYKALKYLYNHMTDDRYTYQLAKIHPNWLLPHAYLRKIKKILGLKVPD